MEGIQSLERKDAQRLAKTELLLALKGEALVLRKGLQSEAENVSKLGGWIQTTLKPSLVQLRQEMTDGDRLLSQQLEQGLGKNETFFVNSISKLGETTERRLEERVAGINKSLETLESEMRDKMEHMIAAMRQQMEESIRSVQAQSSQQMQVGIKSQRDWTLEQVRQWQELQAGKMTQFAQETTEGVSGALQTLQGRLQAYLLEEAKREASERQQWERRQQAWLDGLQTDGKQESEQMRLLLEQRLEALEAATREERTKMQSAQNEWQKECSREVNEAKEWRKEIEERLSDWQKQQEPVIQQLAAAETIRLEAAASC